MPRPDLSGDTIRTVHPELGPDSPNSLTPEQARKLARFGELLKALRGERGITQTDVHDKGGPSERTLSGIESGSKWPGPSTLGKLRRALHTLTGLSGEEVHEALYGSGTLGLGFEPNQDLVPQQPTSAADSSNRRRSAGDDIAPIDFIQVKAARNLGGGTLQLDLSDLDLPEDTARSLRAAVDAAIAKAVAEFERKPRQ